MGKLTFVFSTLAFTALLAWASSASEIPASRTEADAVTPGATLKGTEEFPAELVDFAKSL